MFARTTHGSLCPAPPAGQGDTAEGEQGQGRGLGTAGGRKEGRSGKVEGGDGEL